MCSSTSLRVSSPSCDSISRRARSGLRAAMADATALRPFARSARRSSDSGCHASWASSPCSSISCIVRRTDCAAAAISMKYRPSRRRASASSVASASRAARSRRRAISVSDARSAASLAALPATAECTSPSSRSSVTPSSASRSRASPASASSETRTKLPPPRPRRVSTRPLARRSARASRSVTVDTLSDVASSSSAGSCSPSPISPSAMALPSRRATASLRPELSSSGANTAFLASPESNRTNAIGLLVDRLL